MDRVEDYLIGYDLFLACLCTTDALGEDDMHLLSSMGIRRSGVHSNELGGLRLIKLYIHTLFFYFQLQRYDSFSDSQNFFVKNRGQTCLLINKLCKSYDVRK